MSDKKILLDIAKRTELKEQFCSFVDVQKTLENVLENFKHYRLHLLKPRMKSINEIDFTTLISVLQRYIEREECNHSPRCECETVIYEVCLETFFGDNVSEYISEVWNYSR